MPAGVSDPYLVYAARAAPACHLFAFAGPDIDTVKIDGCGVRHKAADIPEGKPAVIFRGYRRNEAFRGVAPDDGAALEIERDNMRLTANPASGADQAVFDNHRIARHIRADCRLPQQSVVALYFRNRPLALF